jgi:hypothetical protein
MLKSFLRTRVEMAGFSAIFPHSLSSVRKVRHSFDDARKAERERIRKRAGVTAVVFDMAWMGYTLTAPNRVKLWKALGADPATYGIRLVDLGKQEVVDAS